MPIVTALGLLRGGYGAVQLAAPGLLADRLLSRRLDARTRAVARVLGARHLVQALASGKSPTYPVLALGVEVDMLHAGTMIALGIAARARRSTAFADALIAGAFTLTGALAARTVGEARPSRGTLADLREAYAHRLAHAFVPGYPPPAESAPDT